MLVDAHCHLEQLPDIEQALAEAKEAGVRRIISNSESPESVKLNLALARKFETVQACVGLHPVNVLSLSGKALAEGLRLVEESLPLALGVGETGLDFKHAQTEGEKARQAEAFKKQVAFALAEGKAVQVHSRRSQRQCLEILASLKAEKVLMHWFVAKKPLLAEAIDRGYFVSMGPSLLFQAEMAAYAEKVPLESLLLETDCPVPFNGRASRPAWVKEVALKLSALKGLSFEDLERRLEKNALALFGRL